MTRSQHKKGQNAPAASRRSVPELIARYLDGELDEPERAEVEATLLEPEMAKALGEELMLRELLRTLPPDAAPEALIARIEDALGVADDPGFLSRMRGAWSGSRWSLYGVALSTRGAGYGVRQLAPQSPWVRPSMALAGGAVDAARQTVAPLSSLAGRAKPAAPEPKPLWQRAWSLWRAVRRNRSGR